MRYYSDQLGKIFETAEALEQAETAAKQAVEEEKIRKEKALAEKKAMEEKRAANRKAAAERVDKARQAMRAAQKTYKDELEKFIKEYGTYHYSTSTFDDIPVLFDFLNKVF